MKNEIKILLAEDHPVYRDGLRQIVASDPSLKILRETGNGAEALRLARELKPDILILDMDLPGMNGLEVARCRQQERLDFKIIFLTMYREEDMFACGGCRAALYQSRAFRIVAETRCLEKNWAGGAGRGAPFTGGTADLEVDRVRQDEQGDRGGIGAQSAHRRESSLKHERQAWFARQSQPAQICLREQKQIVAQTNSGIPHLVAPGSLSE